MERSTTRQEEAFEHLYRRHRGELYRFLLRRTGNREDAEDVAQTAFLNAYRALARGRAPEKPRAWLYTIAENSRRRLFHAQARRREEPLADEAGAVADPAPAQVWEGLGRLPFNQRAALVLRELGGLSYSEIAEELGVSVASVQMLLFRARRTLREQLEPDVQRPRRARVLAFPWPSWLNFGSTVGSSVDVGLATRAAAVAGAAALGGVSVAVGTGAVPHHSRGGHEARLAHADGVKLDSGFRPGRRSSIQPRAAVVAQPARVPPRNRPRRADRDDAGGSAPSATASAAASAEAGSAGPQQQPASPTSTPAVPSAPRPPSAPSAPPVPAAPQPPRLPPPPATPASPSLPSTPPAPPAPPPVAPSIPLPPALPPLPLPTPPLTP